MRTLEPSLIARLTIILSSYTKVWFPRI